MALANTLKKLSKWAPVGSIVKHLLPSKPPYPQRQRRSLKLKKHPPFHFSLGKRGEIAGAEHLRKHHFKILEKNYRCPAGEIDVVAEKAGRIIFVEIKTRSQRRYGLPEESVHDLKQRRIIRAAEWYLKEHGLRENPISFAVLSVLWNDSEIPEMRLIEHAFDKEE